MDNNIKVIYNKLENMEFNSGYIDLNDITINSKKELADVCDIFRDPRYETFRVFYMKDTRIVGQEAITGRIPDRVEILNKKKNSIIKVYEKMRYRMERLNADGYYLAHNHPSESAKPSKFDIEVTQNFNKKVDGFLGHIIVSSTNRYAVIEKDENGIIKVPREKMLDQSFMDKSKEIDSFYDIKISSREELVALFMKMKNKEEYSTAILTDAQNKIRMVLDIPNKMMNQDVENINGFFKNIARNVGANKVFIGTHNSKTYFKILEHLKYGTFKDIVYIDKENKVFSEKNIKTLNLFDKESKKKLREER